MIAINSALCSIKLSTLLLFDIQNYIYYIVIPTFSHSYMQILYVDYVVRGTGTRSQVFAPRCATPGVCPPVPNLAYLVVFALNDRKLHTCARSVLPKIKSNNTLLCNTTLYIRLCDYIHQHAPSPHPVPQYSV